MIMIIIKVTKDYVRIKYSILLTAATSKLNEWRYDA